MSQSEKQLVGLIVMHETKTIYEVSLLIGLTAAISHYSNPTVLNMHSTGTEAADEDK